jgi:hypothetical protein
VIRHVLVIGAQRSGTTYLGSLLDAHPDVAMAQPASPEPKVFCSEELTARGAEWYRQTFFGRARDGQLLCDKSTSYLEDPKAPARAAEVLGEAHVLVVLRDPVQRAVSNWRFSTHHGFETRPLEQALRENLAGNSPAWDPGRTSVSPFAYLERGRYADYLQPWLATFPNTTHVLFLPELVADPATLDGFLAAAGLDPEALRDRPREAVNANPGEAVGVSPALVGTLEKYFEASNHALSALLGRELPW